MRTRSKTDLRRLLPGRLPERKPGGFRRKLLAWGERRFQLRFHACEGEPGCRRFTVAHPRLRKDGIFLDAQWLCSLHCLRTALARSFATLTMSRGGIHPMPRLPRMPFRLLLLQSGALTETQLAEALTQSERTGLPLARALLTLELVTPAALAAALAAENGCAFYSIAPAPVPVETELPPLLGTQAEAVTVHATASRILVGFVHRIDRDLLRAVEGMAGRRAEPCFITAEQYARQRALTAQKTAAPHLSAFPPEAADALVQQALDTSAERLLLARVRDLLWIRMHCAGGHQDRFFQAPEEVFRSLPAHAHPRRQKKTQAL